MIKLSILKDPFRYQIDFLSTEIKYPVQILFVAKDCTIIWQTQVDTPFTWVQGPPSTDLDVRILDNNGNLIFKYDWIFNDMSDIVEKKFIHWCRNFMTNFAKKPKGVVIGSNSGVDGEWVEANTQNLIGDTLLIEHDLKSFLSLISKYSQDSKFSFRQCFVNDSEGEFYFNIDNVGKIIDSVNVFDNSNLQSDIPYHTIRSKSFKISNILESNPDWIQIDAKGKDYKIIEDLDSTVLSKLGFIIWKHLHLSESETKLIHQKLNNFGFSIINGNGYTSCAYKFLS